MKSRKKLTYEERVVIEKLYNKGVPVKVIADTIDVSFQCIYRELKRGMYDKLTSESETVAAYSADIAQQNHEYRSSAKGLKPKIQSDPKLLECVEDLMGRHKLSPEATLKYIKDNNLKFETEVCLSTLYNYIRGGKVLNFSKKPDMNKIKNECVAWIRDFFEKNGKDCNAVVGISGGKDSSIAAALCVEALGKDRVIGVLMPQGDQHDIDKAFMLVNHLGIKHYVVNIKETVDAILKALPDDLEITKQSRENIPPRIRMSTLYAVSQSVNGRVCNTCNLSEDWVGYSTRYGDSVGDFSPMSNLTVTEVKEIGHLLGVPSELVEKTPIDGLCGKTDEENLGFTYATLDEYIRTGKIDDEKTKELIDRRHKLNLFKLQLMPSFDSRIEVKAD